MTSRLVRLKKLLAVQEQLKALHEVRHAGFVTEAAAARQEATDLVAHFNASETMSALFPEVYHRRVGAALAREDANRGMAEKEASRLATATARTSMVERSYHEARAIDYRHKEDCERLDLIGQRLVPPDRGK